MATKTLTVAAGNDGNFGALVDSVDQTAATRTDGWTVGKVATNLYADIDIGTKLTTAAFTSTVRPAGLVIGSAANAFKTPSPLSGVFAATAWTFTFAVRASTASSQAGLVRVRVFKSVNADGSSATELTGATLVTGPSAALSTTADATISVTWSPGSLTLNNEYLFFAIAWATTTAGGSNSADVLLRTGQSSGGSRIATPDFVANTLVSGTDNNGTVTEATSIAPVTLAPATDANGATTEATSIVYSPFSGTDQNGAVTEAVVPLYKIQGNDLSGVITEGANATTAGIQKVVYEPDQATYATLPLKYATYSVIPPRVPTYADLLNITAPLPAATETASVAQGIAGSDSGTASENISSRQISDADVGTGTDTAFISKLTASSADSGTASESASVTAIKTSSVDSNSTTTEATSSVAQISGIDNNGAVTDTASTLQGQQVASSDSSGVPIEATTVVAKVGDTDVNSTADSATLAAKVASSDAGTDSESAAVPVQLSSTDANGSVTESATVAQFYAISGSDTNGAITETAAFNASYTLTDAGVASEITSMALPASDSNGAATENATLAAPYTVTDSGVTADAYRLVITPANVETGVISEAVALVALLTTVDAAGAVEIASPVYATVVADSATASESAAVTRIQLTDTDSNGSTIEGIGSRALGAVDTNGVLGEISSLNTPKTGTDTGLGAIESASGDVPGLTGSDAGSGADSAVESVLLAPSDTILTVEAASIVVKVTSGDQNGLIETGIVLYRATVADSWVALESLKLVITTSDASSSITESAYFAVKVFDGDFNRPSFEIAAVHVLGTEPVGTHKSITAIDGVDRTSITVAGNGSSTTITDVNEPDRVPLLGVNSVDPGILIAVTAEGGEA